MQIHGVRFIAGKFNVSSQMEFNAHVTNQFECIKIQYWIIVVDVTVAAVVAANRKIGKGLQ